MSTKRIETCRYCQKDIMPIDTPIVYEDDIDFSVKIWRYRCSQCEWIWANALQRIHNSHEYWKARKYRNARLWDQ